MAELWINCSINIKVKDTNHFTVVHLKMGQV